jgi:hypothetical protein
MQHLGLSAEAQDIVATIRTSPPSRAVTGRAGNVCVRYPSRKMGMTIQAESHRVELAAIYLMCDFTHILAVLATIWVIFQQVSPSACIIE